jgi:ribosomal protein S6E (S10)
MLLRMTCRESRAMQRRELWSHRTDAVDRMKGAMGNGFALPVFLYSVDREATHGQAQSGLPMAPNRAKFTALRALPAKHHGHRPENGLRKGAD